MIVNIRNDYNIVFKNNKKHCAFKIFNDKIFLSIIQFKLINWIDYLNNINIVFKIIKNYLCDFRSIYINRNWFDVWMFGYLLISFFKKRLKILNVWKTKLIFASANLLFEMFFLNMLFFLFQNIRNETICHAIFCLIFAIFVRIKKFIYTQTNFENFEFNF